MAGMVGMEQPYGWHNRNKGGAAMRVHLPDLAVSGGNLNGFSWAVEEDAWTLLSFDVVSLEQAAGTELGREIERDGILIYEKI